MENGVVARVASLSKTLGGQHQRVSGQIKCLRDTEKDAYIKLCLLSRGR